MRLVTNSGADHDLHRRGGGGYSRTMLSARVRCWSFQAMALATRVKRASLPAIAGVLATASLCGVWAGCGSEQPSVGRGALQTAAQNTAPTVSAGSDQSIIWPAAAALMGSVTDDFLPDPPAAIFSEWSVIGGPGSVSFEQHFNPATSAVFSSPGVYMLRLTATDSDLSSTDDVVITVNSVPYNQAPIVEVTGTTLFNINAGSFLGARVRDDGLPNPPGAVHVRWEQIDGPDAAGINDATATTTAFFVPLSGQYRFRITASDGELSTTAEVVQVADAAAVFNAGPDQTLLLPASLQLVGTATDDGFPEPATIYSGWYLADGPAPVVFGDPSALITTATFGQPGRYIINLGGHDGGVISEEDSLVVTVLASCNGLNVSAGPDQTVILPAAAAVGANISCSRRPCDATNQRVTWLQVRGPGTATFANASVARTSVRFSAAGTYVLRVTGESGTRCGCDDITVRVQPPRR